MLPSDHDGLFICHKESKVLSQNFAEGDIPSETLTLPPASLTSTLPVQLVLPPGRCYSRIPSPPPTLGSPVPRQNLPGPSAHGGPALGFSGMLVSHSLARAHCFRGGDIPEASRSGMGSVSHSKPILTASSPQLLTSHPAGQFQHRCPIPCRHHHVPFGWSNPSASEAWYGCPRQEWNSYV